MPIHFTLYVLKFNKLERTGVSFDIMLAQQWEMGYVYFQTMRHFLNLDVAMLEIWLQLEALQIFRWDMLLFLMLNWTPISKIVHLTVGRRVLDLSLIGNGWLLRVYELMNWEQILTCKVFSISWRMSFIDDFCFILFDLLSMKLIIWVLVMALLLLTWKCIWLGSRELQILVLKIYLFQCITMMYKLRSSLLWLLSVAITRMISLYHFIGLLVQRPLILEIGIIFLQSEQLC